MLLIRMGAILSVAAALLSAQDSDSNTRTRASFDIVSVKPAAPGGQNRFESYCAGGGRFISRGVPLLWSIKWAYGIDDYRLSDKWPAWLNAFDAYTIEAESDRRVSETECKEMTRSLLEDRFQLRMSHGARTVSAYALVVAKNGPKFSDAAKVVINGAVKQSAAERDAPSGWTLQRLANYLASVKDVQRPVIDRTSLDGTHAFTLTYSTRDGDDLPRIFAALQQQLGLKLEPIKAPVEIWSVERVEKPREAATARH